MNAAWESINSLLIWEPLDQKSAHKIAAFDLDSTLIKTKSGNVFPKNTDDWKWFHPDIPKKLQNLHAEKYIIAIFTNQAGIGRLKGAKKTAKIKEMKNKIKNIQQHLNIPLYVYMSTMKDVYRKPITTMFNMFVERNKIVAVEQVFYVGDAAGRSRDFSSSDLKFAYNLNLECLGMDVNFYTPESFLKDNSIDINKQISKIIKNTREFYPFEFLKTYKQSGKKPYPIGKFERKDNQIEMVLLMGPPAAGETTFAKKHFTMNNKYIYVSRDELKTQVKCLKIAKNALEQKKSVVIDNTNPDKTSRKKYIEIAQQFNVPIRCFEMTTSRKLAEHLNIYREILTFLECGYNQRRKQIPKVAYNIYYKKYQPPTNEGFEKIYQIEFRPDFSNEKNKILFSQFLI